MIKTKQTNQNMKSNQRGATTKKQRICNRWYFRTRLGENEEILSWAKGSGLKSQGTASTKTKALHSYPAGLQQQVLPPLNPTCQGKKLSEREEGKWELPAHRGRQWGHYRRLCKRGSERNESPQDSCQSKCIESFVYSSLLCKSFTFAIMISKIRPTQTNP